MRVFRTPKTSVLINKGNNKWWRNCGMVGDLTHIFGNTPNLGHDGEISRKDWGKKSSRCWHSFDLLWTFIFLLEKTKQKYILHIWWWMQKEYLPLTRWTLTWLNMLTWWEKPLLSHSLNDLYKMMDACYGLYLDFCFMCKCICNDELVCLQFIHSYAANLHVRWRCFSF